MRIAARFLAVLALGAGAALQPSAAADRGAAPAQAVTAVAPLPTTLTRQLLATGSVFAWQEVIIAPEVGGYQVASVDVEIGDHVKRGQQLARLSSDLLESQVQIARASLMQAQANLVNVRAALGRGESIAEKGALSMADLDTLRANAIAAEAGVATAQANLDSAELRLRFTRVRAPDDGTITARSVNVGQVVQVGTEMMRLLRRDRIEWRAEVPEADLRSVRVGQKVQVTTVEGGTLEGKVRTVAPTVQSSNRTGLIYVDIPNDGGARPGMFARGTIAISTAAALMVPTSSILVQDGYSYAFVVRADNTVQRRRVQTGTVQSGQIEVTQGLTATDRVVASGVAFLADGQLVNPRPAA